MASQPSIVGRPGDSEDRGADASSELNRNRTDTSSRTCDHHRIPRYELHRPHCGMGGDPRDKQRTGYFPRHLGRPRCQLIRGHAHVLGVAGPAHGEPDHLVADTETADAGTEFGHRSRQVAALTGGKRCWKQVVQRAAPDHSLTRIDSGCPDLD